MHTFLFPLALMVIPGCVSFHPAGLIAGTVVVSSVGAGLPIAELSTRVERCESCEIERTEADRLADSIPGWME